MTTNIEQRLKAHYDTACAHYGPENVLGVFLYGSWNYGTALEDSDVDTKCILISDLYHLAIKPYETKHLHIDDEVCECMTIQHMVANWKKQNINFVEILFTPYCIINPMYLGKWYEFVQENREDIAHYDIRQAIMSMGHQALHTLKQDPTDFKKQMNVIRISLALKKLVNHHPYWHCIHLSEDNRAKLREVRLKGADESLIAEHLENINYLIDNADAVVEGMMSAFKINKSAMDIKLNDFIIDLIKLRIYFYGDVM
jgi:predicted nucleotidyltransferase